MARGRGKRFGTFRSTAAITRGDHENERAIEDSLNRGHSETRRALHSKLREQLKAFSPLPYLVYHSLIVNNTWGTPLDLHTGFFEISNVLPPLLHNVDALGCHEIDADNGIDYGSVEHDPFLQGANVIKPLLSDGARRRIPRRPRSTDGWTVDERGPGNFGSAEWLNRPQTACFIL